MKKPTILKIAILFLLFLQCDIVMSQNLKTFDREYNAQLKGDILVIGNNILNRRETNRFGQVTASPNSDYDGTGLNGNFDMRYINIDNGATPGIFSSSSANLTVPNNRAPGTPCYRVAYAALYWAATLNGTNRNNIEKVKFKVPNTSNSNYQDITGTIIHDITTRAGGINPDNTQAYACFADVTNLLSATNPNGTYTVANVISSEGSNGGTGLSAGWSLFIVYEDSSLPTKAISTFNGFTARQQGGGPNNTVITGFTTIPTGPVQARFAFAALEGDLGYTGDYLQINGTTITPPTRPRVGNANNFFNSTINSLGSIYLDRTPKSRNTLGFDTGVIDIDPSSNVIKNNDTQATITLGTTTDVFIYYFTAFSVDIIAPKIVLTKGVKDINNVDATNKNVTLGEELRYELKFKNEGNDNAKSFTITDQLPINTDFNFPSDIMQLPPGMTIPTTAAGNSYVQYNPTTRTITFTIPNSYVTAVPTRSPEYTIRFKVKVVDDCSKLTDACSNLIQNTARTTYVGDLGGSNTNYGDSSYSSTTGCNIVPQSTNFLVGLDACKNRRTEICTSSMTISASGGYKSYSWSTNSSGSPVIGTSQTLTVTQPGTYYVYNTANPPCVDLQEIITVVDGGGVRSNPIITYADNRNPDGTITGCPIDGKPLPKIYLCGSNDSRSINLNLSGATIVWEKTTCARPTDLSELCADERTSCTWVSAGPNGSLFTANEAGYYRVTINVNGCQNRYYFNVYKTEVSITETHKNIICYNKGNITAQLLTGYEYSLTNVGANTTTNWQNSNVFDIWQAGTYVINYRLRNVPNTCVYKSGRIEILSLTMDPKVENPNEQPNCYGDNGSITVSATAGFSNYYFALYDGANLIQQVGPITANVYTFTPAPGKYYTVEVYTMNGNTKECSGSTGKYINNPASEINVTANAITPLTACSEGKYKITASGGSGGYSFFVDGSTTPQASSENDNTDQNAIIILTPTARDYVIRVRDSKLCEKTITVKVASLPAPVYTVTHTNSNCYDGSSEIRINLTNANGYTMAYSINDGGTYQASPIFSNLSPGNYKVKVKYSITYPITNWPNSATQDCFGPTENVTITGPSAALTASAGVAALAGCTLPDGSGVNQGGKLRINNAQGGTPAYQYSFDGGATWQTSNEKNVLPGTYILVIKDALGCTYTIPYNIILDPRPSDPTIKVEDPVFNCNGTATSTVTVTNGTSSNYSYEYYLDGVANTPISNNVFTNVPSGNHTVSVKYNVTTVSTYSNLLQEDFGKGGYTTTPGINPAYCFEDESTPHPVGYPCGDFNDYQINDGKYAVASSIKTNFGNSWIFAKDHTLPAHPLGRFLCVNVGGSAGIGGILYSKPIKDVIVNQPVIISLWAENLIVKTSTTHADPKLTIQLVNNLNGVGGPETIVATTDTSNPWVVPKTEKWEYKELSLNPGAYNNLSFVIRSYSNEFNGNDVLIDDIWVRQIPESCIAQKNFPIVIDSNKAFSASITGFKDLTCVGSNNGEVTIAAENFNLPYGFDYSLDNGATWINSKVSPVTATGLTSKTYNIRVRFDNSTSSCVFPLTQVIKAPTAITPSANVTKQATCTTGATITAGATGGTPAYQFQLMNGAAIVAAFQTSGIFTNIPTGTYTVVVRDSNSCLSTASTSVTVVAPTAPTATLAATSDLCYDTTNQATLVVTASGTGTLNYSLDGAPAQNSNTFMNVGPGTHNIVVTDSNNCTATISNIVIAPQLGGEAKITSELNCTTTPNASITVTITGGTSAFTYKVRKGAGTYGSSTAVTGSSFVYTGANTADTYYFEITDSKGCVVVLNAIVNTITNPTVTAQKVDATCNGASTGSVQLSGAGGAGNYTYLFYSSSTTPVPTTFVTQSNYTGLAAGSYSYQVMDDKGCKSAVGTVVITQPTTLTATASATTFTCDASNVKQAATVTIAVPTTGTSPYQYSFDGGTTFTSTRTLSVTDNGTNQTISYVVSDAQGCKTPVQTITINRLNPPTDLSFSAAAVTCNAATTTVTATATNGVAPLTFAITSPAGSAATNSTGVFAGLAPGVYNFRVTDANGCYYNEAFTINSATPIVVTPNKVSDVLCRGGNTGSGTYTVSGVATAGAYTYTITPNTGTVSKSGNVLTLTNAAAGTYTVQVTDSSTGCTSSADITFTQPAAALTVSSAVASNVSCNNDNSQITVTASGGTPNYTYAFAKNPSTVPSSAYDGSNILTVDTNSGADLVWDVYVKDANGCTVKSTVTVIVDALPQITAVTVNNQCTASGSTFTITAAATGLAPLTYSIDGTNFQSSSTFTVAAGSYTVSVKDKNGCIASAPAATVVYPQLTTGAQVTKELDCTGTPNAVITVTIGGGRAPFTYTVQKGSAAASAPSAPITAANFTYSVTAANADTYTFVVTDANGCSKTATATVDPISNPTVTASPVAATCNGNADGSVTLTGAGGSGNYTYSNNATTGFTVNPVFTGLAAGSYTFYVKDGKGCTGSVAVTISQPLTLAAATAVVGFTCNTSNGKAAGTVTVNVTAGTGTAPYQYSFNSNGFGSNNVLTLNDNGADQNYSYEVRDAKGCTVSGTGTLLRLNPPTDLTFAAAAVTCNAATTTVTLTATNGVGALQYETIAPSPVIIAKQTSNSFAGLAPGTYMFKVTDANGCYYTEAFTINPATPITLIAKKTSDVLCNGGNTGSIRLDVAGFAATSSYSYTVNGGTPITGNTAATVNLAGLTAGTYAIVVTDETTGCSDNASITINQPAAALTATYAAVNGNCFVTTSEVTVTAAGGTPVYRYSFVPDGAPAGTYSNNNKANLDPATPNWDVYILDANNCSFKLDITITRDAVPTVTASATGQCFGVGSYTITATPGTGLVAPLSYSINNGASYQSGNTFVITTPGSYTVRIKDGNGCTADSNVVIVNNPLTLSAILDKDITCSAPAAAQVTLTAAGGNGTYTYTSSPNTGTFAGNVFTTTTDGTYTFTVTDSRGCTATSSAVIITPTVTPEITGVTQTQAINCNGEETAAISVTYDATKGLAPFVINVLNTTTGKDYGTQTSGLAAGTYTITVRDARGCFDIETITISEPLPISVAHHAVPITCNTLTGISKGSVIVDSVTGGVGPYNYYVTGVNGYNNSELNNLGTTSVSFNVVDFGLYQINVVDRNGCSVLIQNVLVASPPEDLDITVTPPAANCSGLGSAVVAIGAASTNLTGNGPFHFAVYTGPGMTYTSPTTLPWYDEDVVGTPPGTNPGSKKVTIPNLIPGVQYTFIVHDAYTGCYYFETADIPISTNSTLTTSALTSNNITCKGSANGNVSFTINSTYSAATPISYEIYNSQSMVSTGVVGTGNVPANGSFTVSNLGPLNFGNYIVVIRETAGATNAGCSVATVPFNITESAIDLSITASVSKNANCNANSGVITAVAKDGTAPYTYLLLPSTDPAPTAATAGWASANTFNRNAGTYTAYVKDAYGCIKSATVTLDKDDDPTITAPATFCYTGSPFNFTIVGTVDPDIAGAATYSVNGSAFQASPTFTFNEAKVYTLVIKDGNGCTATTTYEVKPQLFLEAKLTRELDCTATPNAEITLTATGGYNTAYTYEYSTNGGGSYTTMATNVLSTSALGDYIFRVSDAKLPAACQATTTFRLDPLPAAVFTTAQTDVICNGGTDGTITVNVTSGVGPYMYQLGTGIFQSSNVFTGLSAGTSYIITVRDAKSCTYSSTPITIGQPTALTASSTITAPLACGTGNAPTKAIVTVTASNGTAPYQYSFDGGTTYTSDNTFETFAGTTFNVLVKDAHNCLFTLTNGVNVPALNAPTDMDINGTPIYCAPAASTTSTVTISNVQNGVGTLQYEILSPIVVAKQTSATFAGLTPETYLFQVTDANGCTYKESYTVDPVTNITIAGQLVNNVDCNGNANGAVRFTVANFGTAYTAALTAGTGTLTQTGNTVNVTGLVPGNYTVTVTDNTTNCTAFATVTVTQPAVLTLTEITNVNANCNFGAKVEVAAAGGTPNYRYQFVQDGVAPNAADYDIFASAVLDPGVNTAWDAYVIDANGCVAKLDITIAEDALPIITPSTAPYCYEGGPVNITITGTYVGTPMFSIGNGYQSSPNFVLNAPGNYTFYIKDGNGCIASTPYTLNQELLLQATLTKDLKCSGAAEITLLATQGTNTYNGFEVSFNGGIYVPATSPYTTTADGTYTFKVSDSQGCQAVSIPVVVTPTTTPTATFTQSNVKCTGGSDGSIIVTAANGILPYQYSINGGAFQSSNIFTGLTAGAYTIVVKDAKDCDSATLNVTITEPTALAATAVLTQGLTCGAGNAAQAAVVTINVTAGTGTSPYQYSFNGGTDYSSTNTYTTLTAGTITAHVRDANGCVMTAPVSVTIPALDPPVINTVTGTPIYCAPAASTTSTVTVTVSNGVGTLHYEILSPASAVGNVTGASNGIFTGLTAGTYIFQVTDANGCTDKAAYTVDPLVNITIAGQLINNVSCNGGSNGSVKFDVDNFNGAYTATLIGGPTTGTLTQTGKVVTLTNLPVGNYTIEVVDNTTQCRASASVAVTQPPVLTLTQTTNVNANCNTGAKVSVTAGGGTPNYMYAFMPGTAVPASTDYTNSNNAVLNPATNTSWRAYVIDSKGCETFIPITIATDALPSALTASVASQCPTAAGEYTFTVTVGSGVGPYEYSIGNGFQTSPTFTVNAAGTYDVTVRDANACTVTVPALVTISPALQLEALVTALPSCTLNNGVIRATATGGSGTANYRYTLDGGVIVTTTPAVFNNVTPGTHIIRVRDVVTGCVFNATVEIAPATVITGFALTGTHVSCRGGSDGTITATLAPNAPGVNDNPVYTYTLTGTSATGAAVNRPAQTNNVFANLEAGDYTVTVTSGRGCVDSEDFRVTQPQVITVGAPVIAQYNCASGTNTSRYATITVNTVTGGSGNYVTYEFFKNGISVQRGAENVYTESDYTGGTYTINVYDDKGCMGSSTGTIRINPFISLDAVNVTVNAPMTCISNEDITVTVTSTGGTPALLNYNIAGTDGNTYNQSNTSGVFTGLTIGNYVITVTNPATGCSIQKIHYVNNANTFEIKAAAVNGKICYGTADGIVDLTFVDNQLDPTNDAGIFDYVITGPVPSSGRSTNAGPVTISNLTAGQYTVQATLVGRPYCTVTTVFSIEQPNAPLNVTLNKSNITCVTGNSDGEISAAATGGWDTDYQYQLMNGTTVVVDYSTQSTFSGLSAGTYTVNVKDGKDCTVSASETLVIPAPITVSASANVSVLACYGDDSGVITVAQPTGGQGSNYLYTLTVVSDDPVSIVGPQIDPVFTGLKAGRYVVTVTDGYSCQAASTEITISNPTRVEGDVKVTRNQTCLTLSQITLSATGGTGSYTYSLDGTTVLGSFTSTSPAVFDVPVGKYKYYISDTNGCTSFVKEVEIPALIPLNLDINTSSAIVKCKGEATASILAEAIGGIGNYVYSLLNTSGGIVRPDQADGRFDDLLVGTYRVRVVSGDCNFTSDVVTIAEPATPIDAKFNPQNVTCFGANNGQIEVIASGGTGKIQYAISPDLDKFDSIFVFTKLEPGEYQIVVKDDNGCSIVETITITQPELLRASEIAGSIIPEICSGDKDGAFAIEIKGGTAPYSVSLDNENGPFTAGIVGQTEFEFNGLSGGKHTVYYKDAVGCENMIDVILPDAVTLNPTIQVSYDCVNNHAANRVEVDPGYADHNEIDYSLDGVGAYQQNNIFADIAPGKHFIRVRHTNGCSADTAEFEIIAVAPLQLTLAEEKGVWNVITASAVGGGGEYVYSIDGVNFSSETKFKIYKTGTYTITVRDKNGCTDTKDYYIEYVDVCLDNYFTPNGDGVNDTWGPGCTNIYNHLKFSIFDRYGRVIAKYTYGQKWDGRYNGEELPSGDYWYVLKLNDENDGREFVGHFTLYR